MKKNKCACVSFGYFDGIHLGHSSIIDKVIELSKCNNFESKIITFYDENQLVHTTEREKKYFLSKKGVEKVISTKYDASLDLKEILLSASAKIIVVGKNFKFNGSTLETLKNLSKEIGAELLICDLVEYQNEVISNKMIDKAFEDSDYEKYTLLCGHPYTMIGIIEHGKALGRTVGMPTTNLSFTNAKKIPLCGVYSTISWFEDEKFMGLTNMGKRPSVDSENKITIETFILDFDRDVYDKECVLEVRFFIRGVMKFGSLQEVQKQVQKDAIKLREKLEKLFIKEL